jgi:hypothetical protein
MISDGTLEEFECVISVDRHFISHPITLSCGHHICKKCIPLNNIVKCNRCKIITIRDINNDIESKLFKNAFKFSINELYSIIERSFAESLSRFNGKTFF